MAPAEGGKRLRMPIVRGTSRVCAGAVAALLVLTGCDGGGGSSSSPPAGPSPEEVADREAATAYATELDAWSTELARVLAKPQALAARVDDAPELAPATAEEPPPEYDVAAEIATRVDGIASELGEYADDGRAGLLYYDVYDAYLDHYKAISDLRADATDAAIGRLGNPNAAALATRWQIDRLDRDLRLLRAYDAHLAALAKRNGTDPLWVSSIEYQRSEVAWLADFQRKYQRYVREVGDYAAADAFFDRYGNEQLYFAQASLTAKEAAPAMRRRLAADVGVLADLAGEEPTELPGDAPTVGDAYRWRLSQTVRPTGGTDRKSHDRLTDQLWLLYRLKELEDTPAGVYQRARDMLLLQVTADPRSRFEDLIATVLALRGTFAGATDPRTRDVLDWVEQTLDPATVPVLEPFQTELRALVMRFRPAQGDVFADELWDYTLEKYEKVVTKAARAVDDHRSLTAQIRSAIDATRADS